ncbi:MAG: response regulator [Chloroflexi bacterium]|nr:response regulator [Chloroflexota bacterium]
MRILYIEDDRGTAELVRMHLEEIGYDVTIFHEGENGLAEFYIRPFDLILVDHNLPDMTGIQVIQRIRETNDFPPPMIMLTGSGDELVAVEAMKAGTDDYIVKDVRGRYLHLLENVIQKVVEKQELRRSEQRLLLEQSQLIEELRAFSYAVGHDLKQPLSLLSTSMYLLQHYIKQQDEEKTAAKITQINETVSKMTATLEALILFAHVRDTEDVKLGKVDMTQVVRGVLSQLGDMVNKYEATIVVADEMPAALGYAPWIESIWTNYITNALKYGGTPPHIEIGATRQGDYNNFYWIEDNGQGLTIEQQEKIFLPFSRLQERKAEGHGLGLAIARLIARRLGGEATVTSIPGKGSTFGFTLLSDGAG